MKVASPELSFLELSLVFLITIHCSPPVCYLTLFWQLSNFFGIDKLTLFPMINQRLRMLCGSLLGLWVIFLCFFVTHPFDVCTNIFESFIDNDFLCSVTIKCHDSTCWIMEFRVTWIWVPGLSHSYLASEEIFMMLFK